MYGLDQGGAGIIERDSKVILVFACLVCAHLPLKLSWALLQHPDRRFLNVPLLGKTRTTSHKQTGF
jgi:hypothetical protein